MICPQCQLSNPPGTTRCIKCSTPIDLEGPTFFGPEGPVAPPAGPGSDLGAATGWSDAAEPQKRPSSAPETPVSLEPGSLLADRYEILESLGEGGMGAVYKARDRELDRLVAVKVVRPELARQPDVLRRFKQEMILARKVTHRNVLRIFDLGRAGGTRFITMEYVQGQDLKHLLGQQGKFPAERAVEIIRQVCLGLEAAHHEKVVHRDLKPQNVMVDPQGRIALMDFGLAHSVEMGGLTRTGVLMGTPDYMSPEQARGEKVDARSDLFSLGVIFYELLTGRLPYESDTVMGALLKRTQERPTPPVEIDPTIPRFLSDVVLTCTAIDPAHRYQSVREILDDLDSWQSGAKGKTAGIPQAGSLPKRGFATATWKWMTLGVLAVGFFALRDRFIGTSAPKTSKTILVADFNNTTGDPVFDGTLESMFNIAMEDASFVNSYNRGQARDIALKLQPNAPHLDESLTRLVAMREGISVVISGSIAREGPGYRVSARAVDAATGKLITSGEQQAGSKEAVLGTIGRLAAPIRTALGDATPESVQIAATETYTASSLDAAHLYALAQDDLAVGKRDEAIAKFEQAVGMDPKFGRAFSGLAVAYMNSKKQTEAGENYKKALALLDRMSEREKYRTLGIYYLSFVRNYQQAIETFRKLVDLFPADEAAHSNLSLAYAFTGKIPEALAASKRALEISPNVLQDRANYAGYSMLAGDFDTAITEVERILKSNPSFEFAYLPLALSTLARGDVKGAREIYARLEKLSSTGYSLAKMGQADLEMYLGRNREALEALQPGIVADRKENNYGELAHKLVASAEVHLSLGQRGPAVEEAGQAAQASPVESILYLAARVQLQAGEDARARQLAARLESLMQDQTKSDALLIEGEIALQRNRLGEAVHAFRDAQKLRDTWISHFLLGRAYTEAGHFAEALTELETCRKRRGEATDLFLADMTTLRYLPPLHYWMGRAQEGLGMTEAARKSYHEFLALRAEADAGAPLVDDARRRGGGS